MQITTTATFLLFLGILFLLINKQYSHAGFFLILSVFFLVIAFNAGGGWDFDSYKSMYYNLSENLDDERVGYGYGVLLIFANKLGEFRWLLVMTALISTIFLKVAFSHGNKKIALSSLIFFLLSTAGLLHQISEMRQGVAVCIFTASACLLYRRQYYFAGLTLLLSFLFHSSALLITLLVIICFFAISHRFIFLSIISVLFLSYSHIVDFLIQIYPIYIPQIISYLDNENSYGKYYLISTFFFLWMLYFINFKIIGVYPKALLLALCISVLISIYSYDLGRISNYLIGPLIYIFLSELEVNNRKISTQAIGTIFFIYLIFMTVIFRANFSGNDSFNKFSYCFLNATCL